MKKRLLILGGVLLVFMAAGIVALSGGGADQSEETAVEASPSPAQQAVVTKKVNELPFIVELPTIDDEGKLRFATHRNTALATARADGSEFKLITGQDFPYLESVRWSTSGERAVLRSADNKSTLFQGEGKPLKALGFEVNGAAWAPDGSGFAYVTGKELKPHFYELESGKSVPLAAEYLGRKFAWSADSKQIAIFENHEVEHDGGQLVLFDRATKRITRTEQRGVVSASWSPSGKLLLLTKATDEGPRLFVYTIESNQEKAVGIPALAEKTAWKSDSEAYIAGPEDVPNDYLTERQPVSDRIWKVAIAEGTAEPIAELENETRAIRILENRLITLTNTVVYEIDLSAKATEQPEPSNE